MMQLRSLNSISLFLLVLISVVSADPAILNLKEYTNGTQYMITNVEEGGKLYIASNDAPANLNNIQLQTGGNTYLLSDLAVVNPDGTPKSVVISKGLTLSTTNPNSVTYILTGYLYVTTAQQAQDPTFGVYVITGTHHISLSGDKSTTVILNTQLVMQSGEADQPQKTTYVSNLAMTNTQSVSFQWGVPSGNWLQSTNQQFFMNPFMVSTTQQIFFDNVEPLQVGLDYWYIISSGSVSMDMKNTYVANHNYTATAVSTTGVLVSNTFLFDQHTVNFLADPTHSRTVGTLVSAYPTVTAVVFFVFNGTDGSAGQIYDNKRNATQQVQTAQLSAETFTVSSKDITAGVFYCQYFIKSSDLLPVVTTASTAQPPVTQAAGSTITGGPISSGTTPTVATGGPAATTKTTVTGATVTPGTGSTSTATVATTTSSVPSISVVSSVLISIILFVF